MPDNVKVVCDKEPNSECNTKKAEASPQYHLGQHMFDYVIETGLIMHKTYRNDIVLNGKKHMLLYFIYLTLE